MLLAGDQTDSCGGSLSLCSEALLPHTMPFITEKYNSALLEEQNVKERFSESTKCKQKFYCLS